jgi:integrase
MRGHVVRRGDAWRVHVYVGRDEVTGKQRYLTRTVRGTKREAEKVCASLVVEASKGKFTTRTSGTLDGLLQDWLAHLEQYASPSTIATYRGYVQRWIVPRLGDKKIDRLRPDDFDRLYVELRKHLGTASVLKIHTILRSALQQAVKWRMLSENPAALATRPRPVTPPIRPPTPEQVARLLAAADEYDPDLAVYLRLAAVTGARRGELCALKWSDVDLEDGEVLIARSLALGTHEVVEKETKTYRSRRIALDPGTVKALEEQRARMENRAEICEAQLAPDAYVFARDVAGRLPWRPDSGATGRFLRLRKKIGLDTIRLHDLRHYVATRLLDGGVPVRAVSERLGHATATTTLAIYAHAVPATDRRAAQVMGDLLDGPAEPAR